MRPGAIEIGAELHQLLPLLLAQRRRPARVFKTRPIVLSLARSTMLSSTTLFSNNRKVQRTRPLGGLEHAKAINLASFSPSKIRGMAGLAGCLRPEHCSLAIIGGMVPDRLRSAGGCASDNTRGSN
jgi:hypothetical protein